jgi:hypothetical protein
VFVGHFDDLLHMLVGGGVEDHVHAAGDLAVSQFPDFVQGLAVGVHDSLPFGERPSAEGALVSS